MFSNKMDVRKKAMAAMMKEGAGSSLMKKKPMIKMGAPAEGSPQEESQESPEQEAQEEAGQGFEQMMVSPEEKEMILEMRGESEGGEQPHGHSGMMAPKPKGM